MPEQVNAIFRKMVAKKVADRYQTMTEVIADLQACGLGHDQSLTMQRSISSNLENSALTFLKNIPAATTHRPKPTKKTSSASNGKKKLIYGAVGAGLLGVLILAGIIVSLQTKDGTLIVEVNQSDAMVQVLDEQGKVEVSQKGGVGKLTISVDPGKHRLKVEKDGFTFFGENFEMESGGKKAITAKLVPVKVVAGAAQPNQPWNTPAFQQWAKDVQALPAEQQIEAVSKRLMELNPGFDGKLTGGNRNEWSMIRNGVVEEAMFYTDSVTDLSPLRVFQGLKKLRCMPSSPNKCRLSDLSPLQGMPLVHLDCTFNNVSDLSPLRGMPLTVLRCESTLAADLSPLKGMLLGDFDCHNSTHVSDLSPLKGMPLTKLHCYSTQVSDLSPLQGMNLVEISIAPKNITKGMDVIRQIKSLNRIEIGWKDTDKFSVAEFWKKYDAGEFGEPASPPQPNQSWNTPAFQAWMKGVQAMPAEKQVEAVSKKLMELNPGFDGIVTGNDRNSTPKVEGGVVTEFSVLTDNVTDISPVRALTKLKC